MIDDIKHVEFKLSRRILFQPVSSTTFEFDENGEQLL